MARFDHIRCEFDLPNGPKSTVFLTKDTLSQSFQFYTLKKDGKLIFDKTGQPEPIQYGDIEFYSSTARYVAYIKNDKLVRIDTYFLNT